MPTLFKYCLVCGNVEGYFKQVFGRVAAIAKKNGPFSMLLCVGEFFGDSLLEFELYKSGASKVPLLTFVLGPLKSERRKLYPDLRGCELAPNVIYLGPQGFYKCSSGLTIAYMSGPGSNPCEKESPEKYNSTCLDQLLPPLQNKPKVDILLTNDWPKDIFNYTSGQIDAESLTCGSAIVSYISKMLKPLYHYTSGLDTFYERLPYRNHQILNEAPCNVTRFISLAKVGNVRKQKWLYAFKITPASLMTEAELNKQPPDITENPYGNIFKHDIIKQEDSNRQQFFYNLSSAEQGDVEDSNRKRKNNFGHKERSKKEANDACWFCLSSPSVEKHLVLSVGTYCYLSLAKGGLVKDNLLILPIEHYRNTLELEPECMEEIEKYKLCLEKMFNREGKGVVFFERNSHSPHLQIQVIPVPAKVVPQLSEVLQDLADEEGLELETVPKHFTLSRLARPGSPFFYIELPSGQKFFHAIKGKFPLLFGREFLASPSLLNIPERVDWKSCTLPQEEEEVLRDSLKEKFKTFDFTLQEESDSDSNSDDSS